MTVDVDSSPSMKLWSTLRLKEVLSIIKKKLSTVYKVDISFNLLDEVQ